MMQENWNIEMLKKVESLLAENAGRTSNSIYERGEDYYHGGMIEGMHLKPSNSTGLVLVAKVNSQSGDEAYQTTIQYEELPCDEQWQEVVKKAGLTPKEVLDEKELPLLDQWLKEQSRVINREKMVNEVWAEKDWAKFPKEIREKKAVLMEIAQQNAKVDRAINEIKERKEKKEKVDKQFVPESKIRVSPGTGLVLFCACRSFMSQQAENCKHLVALSMASEELLPMMIEREQIREEVLLMRTENEEAESKSVASTMVKKRRL